MSEIPSAEPPAPGSRLLSNAAWLAGGRLAGDLAGFLLVIVLSRHFGPEGIGQYAYGFAIASLMYALINLTLEDYAIRECSGLDAGGRQALLARLLGAQLSVAALGALLLFGYVWLVERHSAAGPIILILAGYQVAFAFARSLFVPALARQRMLVPALAELGCRLLAIGGTAALVVFGDARLTLALVPFPIAGGLLCVVAAGSARSHNGRLAIRFGLSGTIEMIRILWPFAAATVVYNVYSRADLIMLSWMRGEADAGIYAPSLKFLEVGAVPLYLLGIAAYPMLSRRFEQGQAAFRAAADGFSRASLFAGGLLAWAMAYPMPAVLLLALGEEFRDAVPVLRMMALLGTVTALELILVRLLLAAHLQVVRVRLQFWAMLLNVGSNLILIPLAGVMGAVAASIFSQIVLSTLYYRALRGTLDIAAHGRSLLRFVVVFAVSGAVGEGLLAWGAPPWLAATSALLLFVGALSATRFVPLDLLLRSRSQTGSASRDAR